MSLSTTAVKEALSHRMCA